MHVARLELLQKDAHSRAYSWKSFKIGETISYKTYPKLLGTAVLILKTCHKFAGLDLYRTDQLSANPVCMLKHPK